MVWVVMQVGTYSGNVSLLVTQYSFTAGKFFGSKTTPSQAPPPVPTPGQATPGAPVSSAVPVLEQAYPAWPLGISVSMHVYLTTGPTAQVFTKNNYNLPHFEWDNITFGDWNDNRAVEFDVNLPNVCTFPAYLRLAVDHCFSQCNIMPLCGRISSFAEMVQTPTRRARSLIGILFTTAGSVCIASCLYLLSRCLNLAVLTRYLPKLKVRKEKNLLSSNEPEVAEEPEEEVR